MLRVGITLQDKKGGERKEACLSPTGLDGTKNRSVLVSALGCRATFVVVTGCHLFPLVANSGGRMPMSLKAKHSPLKLR